MKPRLNPFLVLGALSFITAQSWAADRVKANNADALNLSTSWVAGIPGSGDVAVWDNTVTASNSTILGAPTSWQGIRIANPGTTANGGQITIGGTDTLTLGGNGIDLTATVTVPANLALNVPLALPSPQIWNIAASRSVVVSTAIDTSGNAFTKSGGGTLIWQAASSNLPAIIINGGSLRTSEGGGLPSTASLTLSGGAFESTGGSFVRALGTGGGEVDLSSGASGFSASTNPVVVNLGGASAPLIWGSTPSFNPGTLILNAASANSTLTFENPIDLNGANRAISTGGNSATISSVISGGAFGFTKSGGGTLILTGDNDFSGILSVTGGALRAQEDIGLPLNSALSLNGGILENSGTLTRPLGSLSGQFRIAGGTSGFSAQGGAFTVNIGGAGQPLAWGSTDFNPSTLVLQNYPATAELTIANGINLGGSFRALDVRSGTVVVSGVISGDAGFTLNGTNMSNTSNSVLRFTNTNTYAGRTVIANTSGGRTRLAFSQDVNLGAVPSSPFTDNLILVNGGVLQADETVVLNPNRHLAIGSSAGGNLITGTISVQPTKHLTIPGRIANRSLNNFTDVIASPSTGSLLKIDSGALLLLNEESTYTGATTINAGNFAITKLSNGGTASSIGSSPNLPENLNLNGGRLQYYGEGDSTDRLFTVSAGNTTLESSGAGPVHFTNTGTNVTTSAGGRNLNLTGYTSGNTLASALADGATVSSTVTFTATANQVTVPSATGLVPGQTISGAGIPANTVINSISGTTLTLSAATTGASGTSVPVNISTRLTLVKTGSGSWTLSGTNTHSGLTRVRGGGALTLDYSGNNNTADPIGGNTVVLEAGTLAFQGKTSGTTTDTISTLQLGENQFSTTRTALLKGTGSGVQLTVNTLQGSGGSTQRHDLIDLSSGAGNSVTVNAFNNMNVTNGVLMNNGTRASIILRDTDGSYGFPTIALPLPGTIQKIAPTPISPAPNLASASNLANNLFTAGDYGTTTSAYLFSTLTFDTSGGGINFALGGQINASANGKGLLFTGASDVNLTGGPADGSAATASALWLHNYLSGNSALNVGFNLGTSQTIMFGGPGFSTYSGIGFGNNFMTNGSPLRVTGTQDIATPTGTSYRVTNGAVFEIGADLNGEAAGDLSNPIGENPANDTISRFRFLGDSGISAWTPEPGGFRIANFGNGQALIWGAGAFLTNSQDSGYDGDYTLKLSSARSNATIELQNNISLNNKNRVIEVAAGTNDAQATDAILSGVLSGPGVGFTKTGAGTLALTGASTYTGETRVAAGVLRLGGNSVSPSSRLRIDNGGSVQITGTLYVESAMINGLQYLPGPVNAPGFVTGNLVVGAPTGLTPYDQWAIAKNLPAGKNEPGQDADDDGIKNVVEYAVESNPLRSGDVILAVGDTSPVTLNYQYWAGKTDISVYLESSPDLVVWTSIASSINGGIPSAIADDVVVTGVVPPGSPLNLSVLDNRASTGKLFYRLRVTK